MCFQLSYTSTEFLGNEGLVFIDFNEILLYVQFIEADLRQKLEHAKELTEEAKGTLKDFTAQSTQVEKFINDITTWLTKLEESLMNGAQSETCEGLKKGKVGNQLSLSVYILVEILVHLFCGDY